MKKICVILSLVFFYQWSAALPSVYQAKGELNRLKASTSSHQKVQPLTYDFNSRFDNESSVSYTGQTFRLVLLRRLTKYMKSQTRSAYRGTEQQALVSLQSHLSYRANARFNAPAAINALSPHNITAKNVLGDSLNLLEDNYMDAISADRPSKNLSEKIAGNEDKHPLIHGRLLGWNSGMVEGLSLSEMNTDGKNDGFIEPEDLVSAFFKIWAYNASSAPTFVVNNGPTGVERIKKASVTKSGLDLAQLTEKFLMGAVVFSQIANDYLNDLIPGSGLNVDNSQQAKNGSKNYTRLEHHWDEGFGYLGAPRDFASYTDKQVYEGLSIDTDEDQAISVHKELVLGKIIKNASRFDLKSKELCELAQTENLQGCQVLELSSAIIQSAVLGRQAISQQPKFYMRQVKSYAAVLIGAVEKTLAITTLHYINQTLKEMSEYNSAEYSFASYSKYWSEMKGFALSFQFNPHSQLSLNTFEKMHNLMQDSPTLLTPQENKGHSNCLVNITSKTTSPSCYQQRLIEARKILQTHFKFSDYLVDKI